MSALRDIEAAAVAALAEIRDPCSVAAGVPAGLGDMGIIGDVQACAGETGAILSVSLVLTHPGCTMAAVFLAEAHRRLGVLPGVACVEVALAPIIWTPDRLAPAYASKLADLAQRQVAGTRSTLEVL